MSSSRDALRQRTVKLAKALLGYRLMRQDGKVVMAGKIVEVEAYYQTDPASHTYRGPTQSNRAMFGPAKHAYIYFTYGNHYCFNVTAGSSGEGAGVLIRALEPTGGIEQMIKNRFPKLASEILAHRPIPTAIIRNLCSGPGKLTQALGIDKRFYGHDLKKPPLTLSFDGRLKPGQIAASPRIGISRATDTKLRFYIKANPFVSR